jgi:hypothetical protein
MGLSDSIELVGTEALIRHLGSEDDEFSASRVGTLDHHLPITLFGKGNAVMMPLIENAVVLHAPCLINVQRKQKRMRSY